MIRVLHVEVGGTYGGSLRALEMYLMHSDRQRFEHDALLYYPTPQSECLRSLVRNLHTLFCAAPGQPHATSESLWRRVKRRVLKPLFSRYSNYLFLVRDVRRAWPLYRFLVRTKYDVVHINNTFSYQAPTLLAAWFADVPVIAHVRNPVTKNTVTRLLLRLSRAIATVSRVYEEELTRWGSGITVGTCYDSLNPPSANPEASTRLRNELLNSGGVLIGSVGRLDEQKGYCDLIRAARLAVDRNPDFRFVIAGEGPLRPSLEHLIKDLGLQHYVHLCGFRKDVATVLSTFDFFVCSSYWEGLPLAILEAMLLDKAVIATAVGGNIEIVRNNPTSRLVPACDPEALANAIVSTATYLTTHPQEARISLLEAHDLAARISRPEFNARQFERLMSSCWEAEASA